MIAFGIDPGSLRMGWGVVEADGSKLLCLGSGVIRAPKAELPERLGAIFESLSSVLAQYAPEVVVLESMFHHKNAKSAIVLAEARGGALLAAHRTGRPIRELSPAEVKRAVTGNGRAEKNQVQEMIRILLGLKEVAATDASDALAVAIAGAQRSRFAELVEDVEARSKARKHKPQKVGCP